MIIFFKKYKYVIYLLVKRHFLLRYRRTKLGYLWTILNPLIMMIVLSLIFSSILQVPLKDYALFFFSGMLVWNYFSFSISQASNSIIENEALINKIFLPKVIFPLCISISLLIDALLGFIPFLLIMIGLGLNINYTLLSIPISYLIFFFFILGINFIVSVATVFFRDLTYIIPIFLQAVFFLTPILYPVSRINNDFLSYILSFNPINIYINLVRNPILNNRVSEFSDYFIAIILSLLSLSFGLYILNKYKKLIIYSL